MGGVITSSPSMGNDSIVYIGITTGRIFALNESGVIEWYSQMSNAAINSSISVDTDGNLYVGSTDGKLYSLTSGEAKDGHIQQEIQ